MENFNEFRHKEAGKLREIRKIDKVAAQAYLERLQETDKYKETKSQHMQERDNKKEQNLEPESVEENMDLKQEIVSSFESELPEGFEISKSPDGKIEIILKDQNNWEGWSEILSRIKDKVVSTMKLYDFDGKDDIYIEIKKPLVLEERSKDEAFAVRYNEEDIDKNQHDFLTKSDAVATSYVMSLVKPHMLICHKGMVRSVTV